MREKSGEVRSKEAYATNDENSRLILKGVTLLSLSLSLSIYIYIYIL
jgi:hypothetical protein